jgi:hypothetical protein
VLPFIKPNWSLTKKNLEKILENKLASERLEHIFGQ